MNAQNANKLNNPYRGVPNKQILKAKIKNRDAEKQLKITSFHKILSKAGVSGETVYVVVGPVTTNDKTDHRANLQPHNLIATHNNDNNSPETMTPTTMTTTVPAKTTPATTRPATMDNNDNNDLSLKTPLSLSSNFTYF